MHTPRIRRPALAALATAIVASLAVAASPLARADEAPPVPKPGETPVEPEKAPAEPKPGPRGYIGFQAVPAKMVPAETRAELKVPADAGVLAMSVLPRGPAGQAGMRNGDVLVSIAGKDLPDTKDLNPDDAASREKFAASLQAIVGTMTVGKEVEVVVRRREAGESKGESRNVALRMTPIEKERIDELWRQQTGEGGAPPPPAGVAPTADHGYVGFSPMPVALLSDAEKERWSVKATAGVIATHVIAGSPATKAGLMNGDVLKKFHGEDLPVWNTQVPVPVARREFRAAFASIVSRVKVGAEVEIVIERDGKPVTLRAKAIDLKEMQRLTDAAMDDDEPMPEPAPGPETRPK